MPTTENTSPPCVSVKEITVTLKKGDQEITEITSEERYHDVKSLSILEYRGIEVILRK